MTAWLVMAESLRHAPSLDYTPTAGFEGRRSEWVVHPLFLLPKNWFEALNLMGQAELSNKIQQEFAAVAEDAGCELLESQFRGGVLRLVIDKSSGVTLEDCRTVSRQVSSLLDVEDFGPGKYVLEVTSPGLDRKLYIDEDYQRFSGQKVRITWKEPEMTQKKTVVGTLAEYQPENREILLVSSEPEENFRILLKNIVMARLEPEI